MGVEVGGGEFGVAMIARQVGHRNSVGGRMSCERLSCLVWRIASQHPDYRLLFTYTGWLGVIFWWMCMPSQAKPCH